MRLAQTFPALVLLLSSACATTPSRAPGDVSPESWGALLAQADAFANAGRHSAADSALLAFERAHPGTRAASEVLFWRALYKLDPRSTAATRAEGRVLMETYAASPTASWYRGQANVLRHLARAIVEAADAAPADTVIVAGDTSSTSVAARDRIIRNQRAEISRLNAELERIKRRLATPTP